MIDTQGEKGARSSWVLPIRRLTVHTALSTLPIKEIINSWLEIDFGMVESPTFTPNCILLTFNQYFRLSLSLSRFLSLSLCIFLSGIFILRMICSPHDLPRGRVLVHAEPSADAGSAGLLAGLHRCARHARVLCHGLRREFVHVLGFYRYFCFASSPGDLAR
jgi:hypothetical protein